MMNGNRPYYWRLLAGVAVSSFALIGLLGCDGDGGGSGSSSSPPGGSHTPVVDSVQLGLPISSVDGEGEIDGPFFNANVGEIIVCVDSNNPSGHMSVWMQVNAQDSDNTHYDWEIVDWQNHEPFGDLSFYDQEIDIDDALGIYKVRSYDNKVCYDSTTNSLISSNHVELIKVTAWTVDGYFSTAYFSLILVPIGGNYDPGDTVDSALLLGVNGVTTIGEIATESDVDLFRFYAAGGNAYSVNTRGLLNTQLIFGDSQLATLPNVEFYGGGGTNYLAYWTCPISGIYYVQADSFGNPSPGGYSVAINEIRPQGVDYLNEWDAFRAAEWERYSVGLIGDSYTHNRSRYSRRLKRNLADQFGDLGAGYLSFGFITRYDWSDNGAIDALQLDYSIDHTQWTPVYGKGYGPDGCHVTSATNGESIVVHVYQSTDALRLFYLMEPVSREFRYRVAGGAWTSVSVNGIEGLGVEVIDVSVFNEPFDIEIQALDVGVTLMGLEAVVAGDGVVVHKLGVTGGIGANFANNSVAVSALQALRLDMAVIMFGTNEQLSNISPVAYKSSIQRLIDCLRSSNPDTDLVLMLPCYTKYEIEVPRTYSLQDYGVVLRDLAVENNGCFLDFTEVFGPATELQNLIDAGLMNGDRIHPTTGDYSGGALMADAILHSVLAVP